MKFMNALIVSISVFFLVGNTPSTLANGGNNKEGVKHAPKNIIIMISDGCGYSHIDATSIYQYGKAGKQVYESFPVRLAMSTFDYTKQGNENSGYGYDPDTAWNDFWYVTYNKTDSASAATAMSTGVKTYNGAIGVDLFMSPLSHLMQRAEDMGKMTGVITSVQWSHATPAGFVAHNVTRNDYSGIAQEMIYNSAVDVIMGCGHPWFDNDGIKEITANTYKYVGGESTWNELVTGIAGGDADGDGIADPWKLVQTLQQFRELSSGETPNRVVGVAQVYSTLQQSRSGNGHADPYAVSLTQTVPTLAEMTAAALNVLDNDSDGFVLMVEGGAVDWAGHGNQSGRLIEEEIDFNRSVETVVEWVQNNSDWGETLVIVTGDHETGYLTGPGSGDVGLGPVWNELENNGKGLLPGMQWNSGDHTNSLIPFFAKGRGAKLFEERAVGIDPVRGAYLDNTEIARVIFDLFE